MRPLKTSLAVILTIAFCAGAAACTALADTTRSTTGSATSSDSLPDDRSEYVILYSKNSNYAWYYYDSGVCVTNKGNVYCYTNGLENGPLKSNDMIRIFDYCIDNLSPIGTIDTDYLNDIYSLTNNVDPNAKYTTNHAAEDAGFRGHYFIDADGNAVLYHETGDNEGLLEGTPDGLIAFWDEWTDHASDRKDSSYSVYTTEIPITSICYSGNTPNDGIYILYSLKDLDKLFEELGVNLSRSDLDVIYRKSDFISDENRIFVEIRTDAGNKGVYQRDAFLIDNLNGTCFFANTASLHTGKTVYEYPEDDNVPKPDACISVCIAPATYGKTYTDPTYGNEVWNRTTYEHSIAAAGTDRPREIARTSDVIRSAGEAQKYLESCVSLPDRNTSFMFADATPVSDEGAYQWYRFIVCYNDIPIYGSDLQVVTFYDGSLVEGRSEVMTCSFDDSSKVMDKDEALSKFLSSSGSNKTYTYRNMYYMYSGKYNETCHLCYCYRYEGVSLTDGETLWLDAVTGELKYIQPDVIY